tara:strand:- start:2839 stop:7662 length:4824 start_codon:yes stop_codon:yes gene_type:complete
MPIVTTNFIAGRMNKSIDERLLPPGEYIDALNVRLGATETTEIGAVENSKGNEKLTTVEFLNKALSPTAVCIGAYEDGTRENLYWFIHDKNFTTQPGSADYTGVVDLILSFNTTNQVLQYHVISTSVLNFNESYLITGVDLVDGDLLFFTDDYNPPRVINIGRSYPEPVANVDQIVEEDLSVVVKPPGFEDVVGQNVPLTVPGVKLVNLPGNENYLKERFVCFAYRYRYLDNGYSATSLFSKPAFATSTFAFDTRNYLNSGMVNRYNGAVITFSTGSSRVSEIDLLYKDTTSNIIYVIERFKKQDYGWADNTSKSYSFTNSKIYTTIGADELLRQYDNVPRFAKAQTIMSNRLFYGNFIDGYDFKYGSAQGSTIALNYSTQYVSSNLDFISLIAPVPGNGAAYTISGSTENINNSKITFNLTQISDKLKINSVVSFSFSFEQAKLTGTTTTICYEANEDFKNANFNLSISITLDQDYSSVYDFCSSPQFENAIGTGTLVDARFKILSAADTGSSLTDLFNNQLTKPPNTCTFNKFNSSITDATNQQGFALTGVAPGSNTFELQVIAMNYRATDPSDPSIVTDMFEFFRFVSGETSFSSIKDTSSLHSNRDYETGIVYMDEYARASTVLVSEYNTVYIEPANSVSINKIKVQINSLAPYWAKKYKFVLKPSLGNYETIFSNFYYVRPSDNVIFFKLEGDNANKVTKGQTLIVKADVDGALPRVEKVTVLDVTAESTDFLKLAGEVGFEELSQLPGLYMNVKNQNFNVTVEDDSVIEYGNQKASYTTLGCDPRRQIGYPCFTTQYDNSGAVTGTTNYTVPGGSIIKLKFRAYRKQTGFPGAAEEFEWEWDQQYVASRDYTDLKKWYDGDNVNVTIAQPGNMAGFDADTVVASYDTQYVNVSSVPSSNPFGFATNLPCTRFRVKLGFVQDIPGDATSPLYFGINSGIPGAFRAYTSDRKSSIEADIIVFRADTLMVFESEPLDANPDLYYDSSQIFNIENGFHLSGTDIDGGDQKQTATQDAIVNLNFADVYCFGNGVESYKIKDQLAAKSFQLGERTLAVSNQDYKETDRFEGLTYSGVYSSNSGTNNLNEFNLGLVNFKDLETSYGPIQKLYARKTDILTLQEDKISYVQAGKNILTDAVGGGVVTSVPQVLGQQVARIEEYGISFNPESFAIHGFDTYFTDSKRGAVIMLSGVPQGESLTVISDSGMRSFFRDEFYNNLNNQKLGGFDPYMDEYVLAMNQQPVPIPPQIIACGTSVNKNNLASGNNFVSTINYGNVIGNVPVGYNISSGTITITVLWNGVSVTSGSLTGSGNYNWAKTLNTPTNALITITAVGASASFVINFNCPDQVNITVVKVVLNSAVNANKYIHTEYIWQNSTNISPVDSDLCQFGSSNLIASTYDAQVGVRSLGVFPYSGVDLTIRSNKINFDDYDWLYPDDNFKYLSSNTSYANNQAGIVALLAAATTIPNSDVTSPSSGLYQATISSLTLPIGNQYLYLIYDYRTTSCQQFCFDAVSAADACCECTLPCVAFLGSTVREDAVIICNQPLSQTYYHTGSGTFPAVGDFVFSSSVCTSSQAVPLQTGFYKSETNKYIRVSASGIVSELVTCP